MAKLAHMAPASFSRLFLQTTRKTFTPFVTEAASAIPVGFCAKVTRRYALRLDELEKICFMPDLFLEFTHKAATGRRACDP